MPLQFSIPTHRTRTSSPPTFSSIGNLSFPVGMGIPSDDVVVIQKPKHPCEPYVITVNCPDKTGLGCDVCRIILDFGLYIQKADVTTILSDLELAIQKVKVTTTPDEKVLDLFFITDNI